MGLKQNYECSSCDYEAFTGAGPDRGMTTSMNTFVCKGCNSLIDLKVVGVGVFGFMPEQNQLVGSPTCSNCDGKDFKPWNYKKKPCPKCKIGKMKPAPKPGTMIIHWD